MLPEMQALSPAWVSLAPQRPEDSSHPRLHVGLAAPFQQRFGGFSGSRVPEQWESGFYLGFATAAPISEQTAPQPSGSGMRGSWEETGSIQAVSQCSPHVRSPAFRDLPGWMWFLIYPNVIFLLSRIPPEAHASAERPKAALAGSSPSERRR